ncbi:SET and MYND domain-containing protein 4 [Ostrinia nubilalis]|uniref:SET and MYND domain-containing protein 4 n=1 Tax=Ostrinia nubilalis TaxID=29057 RepID=UPI0030824683
MSRVYEDVDPGFAATCSDITLYSKTKGFFKNFAEDIVSIAENDNWLDSFEKVEDGKKVAAVMENKEIMEALQEVFSRIEPIHRGKDARVSYERRVAGQAALKEGDLMKALSLASQAVLRAPMTGTEEVIDGGVSLALALWLRSEVLLQADRPRAALEDLKLALKERLPAKMRAQYYWRMGHCYRGAGEPSRAKVSYELAGRERLLANDETAKSQLAKDIGALDYTAQPRHPPDKPKISVAGGAKQNMPALSKLLKITEEQNKGRYAVASAPIKTGDILLVDSPYAACLHPDNYGTHCLHCFKRLEDCEDEAPVWCPKCSAVVFCSTNCRDTAVSTYHSYECQFLDLFIGSGMSMLSQIALRIVTQAGLHATLSIHSKYLTNEVKTVDSTVLNDIEGVAKKSKMKSRKERLNRSKKGLKIFTEKTKEEETETKVDEKMNYEEKLELKAAQFYSLCAHSEQRRGGDYLKRIVMAMFLGECLKKAGFFKKCEPENLAKAETCICEMIIRNMQILQFNAHEIYETIRGEHSFSGSKPVYIAVGIYPTGALFNHECYPAVARFFVGAKIVLQATRPLAAGEMASENYGHHFMMRSLKERQRALACRYWFRCECVACKEDWPTLKQMNSSETPIYLRYGLLVSQFASNPTSKLQFEGDAESTGLPLQVRRLQGGLADFEADEQFGNAGLLEFASNPTSSYRRDGLRKLWPSFHDEEFEGETEGSGLSLLVPMRVRRVQGGLAHFEADEQFGNADLLKFEGDAESTGLPLQVRRLQGGLADFEADEQFGNADLLKVWTLSFSICKQPDLKLQARWPPKTTASTFMMRSLKEMQRALACRCKCVACKEDWPTLKQMNSSETPIYLRCLNADCSAKFRASPQMPNRCSKCSTNIERELVEINLENISKCINQYQEGAKLMDAERIEDAITTLCEAVDQYHEIAHPPHRDTHIAQEALRSCFASYGNVHVVRDNNFIEEKDKTAK